MMTSTTDDRELLKTLAQACGAYVRPGGDPPNLEVSVPWIAVFEHAYSEEYAWNVIVATAPDWLHSVDAALTLPWPGDSEIEMHRLNNGAGFVRLLYPMGRIANDAEAPTLARALCECFAAWWRKNHHDNK